MSDRISVHARRRKIFSLLNRGARKDEIIKELKMTSRTLDRDIAILTKELVSIVTKETSETALATLLERSKERVRRLWAIIVSKAATDIDKVRAMRQIQREDTDTERRMERLGIIPPRQRDESGIKIEAAEGASVEVTKEEKTINFHWGTRKDYEKQLKKLKRGKQ